MADTDQEKDKEARESEAPEQQEEAAESQEAPKKTETEQEAATPDPHLPNIPDQPQKPLSDDHERAQVERMKQIFDALCELYKMIQEMMFGVKGEAAKKEETAKKEASAKEESVEKETEEESLEAEVEEEPSEQDEQDVGVINEQDPLAGLADMADEFETAHNEKEAEKAAKKDAPQAPLRELANTTKLQRELAKDSTEKFDKDNQKDKSSAEVEQAASAEQTTSAKTHPP